MGNTVHIEKARDFILSFTSILWESMPSLVLGAVIAGVVEEMLPQKLVARILPRSHVLSILIGGMLGLIFPLCDYGIIPVVRRLIRKGVPLSCCTAYLLAGPIVNIVVILSTIVAFQGMETLEIGGKSLNQMGSWWMTGFRVVIGYLVAVGTSLIVERAYRKYGNTLLTPSASPPRTAVALVGDQEIERRPLDHRLNNISQIALHDFTDFVVFLIFGILTTCTVHIWLTPEQIAATAGNRPVPAILLMMALAIVPTMCSDAVVLVAASFVSLPSASKLAFLVLSPMLDFKLLIMYTRAFRARLIWTIIISVVVQVFVYSVLVHFFWQHYGPIPLH